MGLLCLPVRRGSQLPRFEELREWLDGLRPAKLVIMHVTISTYSLYGLDAILMDVIVGPGGVLMVDRKTGRTLLDVKQELHGCMQAGVQGCLQALARQTLGDGNWPRPT
jgi:hypothetical protein